MRATSVTTPEANAPHRNHASSQLAIESRCQSPSATSLPSPDAMPETCDTAVPHTTMPTTFT